MGRKSRVLVLAAVAGLAYKAVRHYRSDSSEDTDQAGDHTASA